MTRLRLRTKFLLSMLLISSALTCTSLLVVRRSVQTQVRNEIFADLRNSADTFQNFQREREATLTRSAELLADLPNLRALMTTRDEATIQDASADLWRLAGSDLFVLADRSGRVVALHTVTSGFSRNLAQEFLLNSLDHDLLGGYGGEIALGRDWQLSDLIEDVEAIDDLAEDAVAKLLSLFAADIIEARPSTAVGRAVVHAHRQAGGRR